jgi:hypothetical protein
VSLEFKGLVDICLTHRVIGLRHMGDIQGVVEEHKMGNIINLQEGSIGLLPGQKVKVFV